MKFVRIYNGWQEKFQHGCSLCKKSSAEECDLTVKENFVCVPNSRPQEEVESMRSLVSHQHEFLKNRPTYIWDEREAEAVRREQANKLRKAIQRIFALQRSVYYKVKGDAAKFDGPLSDYDTMGTGVPLIVQVITTELENREGSICDQLYHVKPELQEIRRLKKRFKREENPNVRS